MESMLSSRGGIVLALCVVVALGVGGVVQMPEKTVEILGFCGLALAALVNRLTAVQTAERVETVAAKAESVELAIADNSKMTEETKSETKHAIATVSSKVDAVAVKQVEQHKAANGRLDELLIEAKKAAYAEGVALGIAQEKSETNAKLAAAFQGAQTAPIPVVVVPATEPLPVPVVAPLAPNKAD